MKLNKVISLTILSSLMAACGGSGGNSETRDAKKEEEGILNHSLDNTTSYSWGSIQFNTTFVEIVRNKINDDILYTDYELLDSESQPDIGRVMLSYDGLYTPDETKYPLGYRRFNLRFVSQDGTTLRKTPYNKEGHKNLVIEERGRWIDLQNVRVSERTAVYWNFIAQKIPTSVFFSKDILGTQFKNFLALTQETTFPSGAKCFQIEKTNYSSPFYVVTNLETKVYSETNSIDNLNEYISSLGRDAQAGKWGDTRWAYSKKIANDPTYYAVNVYMSIDNKLAGGYLNKNPNTSITSLVKEYEKSLEGYNGYDDTISYTGAIEQIKNECTYYNSIAAQKIEELIDKSLKN
ncbi:hypothetical protein F4U02_00840 [Acinetobacter haemolyticus]|uniref:hypothetical protein n=2 Tax=Acinetobacter haemolyticus TaxID=29430 RepID=UPI00129875AA|nr:hypothetical protein [Acinetobacter haemolyticus]MCU4377968.1 hypothetical protein [Acinetobacter haemolyticus]MQZ29559.1 hypothetical protein [Acinetobacter haemolyticus]